MTDLIFEKIKNKDVQIKWNFSYDDWFIKSGKFKNFKLRRFTSPSVSPLVIGMLSKSVDVVRCMLSHGIRPDGIDFTNKLGIISIVRFL